MTSLQRAVIAVIVLCGATVLAVLEHQVELAIGIYGTVLGYVFGERNAERRLATSILDEHDRRVAAALPPPPAA